MAESDWVTSIDVIKYLAEVAEWVASAPEAKPGYGLYYVSKVQVVFDGESIGTFENEDPNWLFVHKTSDSG